MMQRQGNDCEVWLRDQHLHSHFMHERREIRDESVEPHMEMILD